MPTTADAVTFDESRAVDLVMELMAIDGRSCEEGRVAEYVRRQLMAAGAPDGWIVHDTAHRRTPTPGEVGNLILKLPGTMRAPRRMLSAHLDAVPICSGSEPVRRGDLVTSAADTGLAADNRAGCAVLLSTAIELMKRNLPRPPLTFCWFVQEEIGLQGSRAVTLSKLGAPKLAFNWDGGSPAKLTIGATGGIRMEIEVRGLASHAGGAPERGVSAIAIASMAIADLHRSGWHGDIHSDNGMHGTSNVGVFQGGAATNVVADYVKVRAEARSHNGPFRRRIAKQIESCFRQAVKEVHNVDGKLGKVSIVSRLDYDSFLLKRSEPCVTAAEQAVEATGLEVVHAVANGGVDANWITKHGIPTVSLGCGQRNQHMVTEQLVVSEFLDACRIALRIASATKSSQPA